MNLTSILAIIGAIGSFIIKYGPLARPVIDSVLAAELAAGKLTQAQYDTLERVVSLLLGPPPVSSQHASGATEAEFRALAHL
jgi:hypothetical protein